MACSSVVHPESRALVLSLRTPPSKEEEVQEEAHGREEQIDVPDYSQLLQEFESEQPQE